MYLVHALSRVFVLYFFSKRKKFWFLPYHRWTANRQNIYCCVYLIFLDLIVLKIGNSMSSHPGLDTTPLKKNSPLELWKICENGMEIPNFSHGKWVEPIFHRDSKYWVLWRRGCRDPENRFVFAYKNINCEPNFHPMVLKIDTWKVFWTRNLNFKPKKSINN